MTEWTPGPREVATMQALGLVGLVAGGILYSILYGLEHSPEFLVEGIVPLLVGVALVAVSLAVAVVGHEGVHGLAMLPFGARPRFGFTKIAGSVPAFYCTADGHRFTKAQFTWVALAPTLVLGGLLAWAVLQPWAGLWLVVAAAFHLSGCVGDWLMAVVAGRQPRGTLVEDLQTGMRFHPVG